MKERRRSPRLAKGYRLRLREVAFPAPPWSEAVCRDVSAGGLAVETRLLLPAGALVEVRLAVPRLNLYHPGFFKALESAADQELRAVAEVVRAEPLAGRMLLGLRLASIDDDDRRAWERLLARLEEERR